MKDGRFVKQEKFDWRTFPSISTSLFSEGTCCIWNPKLSQDSALTANKASWETFHAETFLFEFKRSFQAYRAASSTFSSVSLRALTGCSANLVWLCSFVCGTWKLLFSEFTWAGMPVLGNCCRTCGNPFGFWKKGLNWAKRPGFGRMRNRLGFGNILGLRWTCWCCGGFDKPRPRPPPLGRKYGGCPCIGTEIDYGWIGGRRGGK